MKAPFFTFKATQKYILSLFLFALSYTLGLGQAADPSFCDRTQQVEDAILALLSGVSDCNEVTAADLRSITVLAVNNQMIDSLKSYDFQGLDSLTGLNLINNNINTLPLGVFAGLSKITSFFFLSNNPGADFDFPLSPVIKTYDVGSQTAELVYTTPYGYFPAVADSVLSVEVKGGSTHSIPFERGALESDGIQIIGMPLESIEVRLTAIPSKLPLGSGYNIIGDTLFVSPSLAEIEETPQAPAKVTLLSPSDNATDQNTALTLLWRSDSAETTVYQLQVDTDAMFSSPVVNDSNLTDTLYSATLQAASSYYWRVRALNSGGPGEWSERWSFMTGTSQTPGQPPAKVTLSTPANNEMNQDFNVTFSWNSVNMATAYTIQLGRDTAFSAPELNQEVSNTTYNYVLKYDTTYYWRVRASNSAGNGPWSERWTFQTAGNSHMGDLELTRQGQIDSLPSYTKIIGRLSISESSPGDITDLSPLSTVTSVWQGVFIEGNTALDSLSGLSGIVSVGGNLTINDNDALPSLEGLSGITSVGGHFDINNNDALTSLDGLSDGITFLSGNLNIGGNTALTDYCAVRYLITSGQVSSSSNYFVSRNAYNPSYENIQNTGSGGCVEMEETPGTPQPPGQNVFPGDLTLSTQAQVDTFSYTGVSGNLTIQSENRNDITNLRGLSSLDTVGGELVIYRNIALTSLAGLDNLTSVRKKFEVGTITALTSLDGLERLTSVGGDLVLSSNVALTNYCGVRQLIINGQVGSGEYRLINNTRYSPSYDAIQKYGPGGCTQEVMGDVTLLSPNDGAVDQDTTVMFSWQSTGEFKAYQFQVATDSLFSSPLAPSDSNITDTQYTATLEGPASYYWRVRAYDSEWSEVRSFTTVDPYLFTGDLTLSTQAQVDAFSYTGVSGNLRIQSGNAITNLNGLSRLDTVGGYLSINGNLMLRSLSGLENLTSVRGILEIRINHILTSLAGLDGLTSVGASLTIDDNDALLSLTGLESLTSVGENLTIAGHANLTNYCAVRQLIPGQVSSSEYRITATNAYSPSYEEIQKYGPGGCTQQVMGDVTLLSPNDGAVDQDAELTLSWESAGEFKAYQIHVATDTLFLSPVANDSNITDTQYMATLQGGSSYYWRVRTYDSEWSERRSFTTVADDNEEPVVVGETSTEVLVVSDVSFANVDSTKIDLKDYFDNSDDALTYEVQSSNPSIARVSIFDTLAYIVPVAYGSATITLTADDGMGGMFTGMINVRVTVPNAAVPSVCDRTPAVQTFILTTLPTVFEILDRTCETVTKADLLEFDEDGRISLSGDTITTLLPDDFRGMTNMDRVTIGNLNDSTFLKTLPQGLLDSLPALTSFTIRNSPLFDSIPEAFFQNLESPSTLTRINIDRNRTLTHLPAQLFRGLSNLERLELYDNKLMSLPNGIFEGLESLTRLRLDGNRDALFDFSLTPKVVDSDGDSTTLSYTTPYGYYGQESSLMVRAMVAGDSTDYTVNFPKGALESDAFKVGAAPSDIQVRLTELPTRPSNFRGIEITGETMYESVEVGDQAIVFRQSSYSFNLEENRSGSGTPIGLDSVTATDNDGDIITYSLSEPSTKFSINPSNGLISYIGFGEDHETTPSITFMVVATAGGDSETVYVTVNITDVNEAPLPGINPIPAQTLVIGGDSAEIGLSNYFSDEDMDSLRYSAVSDDSSVVSTMVEMDTLILRPVGVGNAIVEVIAYDGMDSVSQYVSVRVTEEPLDTLGVPELRLPPNTSIGVYVDTVFRWSSVEGVSDYDIQIGLDNVFNNSDIYMVNDTFYIPNPYLADSTWYYWRVRSRVADRVSAWSDIWYFNTGLGIPILKSPPNGSINVGLDTLLKWYDVTQVSSNNVEGRTEKEIKYDVEITTDVNFVEDVERGIGITDTMYAPMMLFINTTYYWRVRSSLERDRGDTLKSAWAEKWSFRTEVAPDTVPPPTNSPPEFDSTRYHFSLAENRMGDFPLDSVSATDLDGDVLEYSISLDSLFSINSSSGLIRYTGSGEDYETRDSITFMAYAFDGQAFDTANVTVAITDVNDAPAVAQDSIRDYNMLVIGDSAEIGLVRYFMDDDGDDLSYSAESNTPSVVSAILKTDTLLVLRAVGVGNARVEVIARDSMYSVSQFISVAVINRNPMFDSARYHFSLAENQMGEFSLGRRVIATDPDGHDLMYSLSEPSTKFSINENSGEISYIGSGEDFETKPDSITFTAIATDNGGLTDMAIVRVAITDENDAPMVAMDTIPDQYLALVVDKDSAEINLVGYFTDEDGDTLSYSAMSNDTSVVSAMVETDMLTLRAVGVGNTIVEVIARDGMDSVSQYVSVGVTREENKPPMFDTTNYHFNLAENRKGSMTSIVVDTVNATDPDDQPLTPLTYSISLDSLFSIDSDGIISYIGTGENYEEDSTITFMAYASDGQDSDTAIVTAWIMDKNDPPSLVNDSIPNQTLYVGVDSDSAEIDLARYFEDEDGDPLSYTVNSDPSGSVVQVVRREDTLLILRPVSKGSTTVEVIAHDGMDSLSQNVLVTIPNRPPMVVDSIADKMLILGDEPTNVDISGVFSDPDGDDLIYTSTIDNNLSLFANVDQFESTLSLDASSRGLIAGSAVVRLTANDGMGGTAVDIIKVKVNEPGGVDTIIFPQPNYHFELPENQRGDHEIGFVRATSSAVGDGGGVETLEVTYSLSDSTLFVINDSTGVINYTGTGEDFETEPDSYTFMVIAVDRLLGTAMVDVIVWITDVNERDNFDSASYHFGLPENQPGEVPLGTVMAATDIDDDMIRYSLSVDSLFSVNDTSGVISYTGPGEDYETPPDSYMFMVFATDGEFSDTAAVTVTITNVNEPPVFDSTSYHFSLEENRDGSDTAIVLGPVMATDPDSGDVITYSLSGGNNKFGINENSGEISYIGSGENYEVDSIITFMAIATDNGGLTDAADVTVKITNVNEPPVFDSTSYHFSLEENRDGSDTAIVLGPVMATDPDSGDVITYSLSGVTDNKFSINGTSGVISYIGTGEDFETTPSIMFMAIATDNGGLKDTTDVTAWIRDVDVNDTIPNRPPEFDTANYHFTLAENQRGTIVVDTVNATDPDGDVVQYSLLGSNKFVINDRNGVIHYIGSGENFETPPDSITFMVFATDGQLSDTAYVTAWITDVNEPPVFNPISYNFTLAENRDGSTTPIVLGSVMATDPDSGDMVTYSLPPNSKFSIGASSGVISYIGTGEDFETTPSIMFMAIATDNGGLTDTADVTVTITNVNEPPVFDPTDYHFNLAEKRDGSTIPIVVDTVMATDPDAGDVITYSLSGSSKFSINPSNGIISYIGSGEDFETTPSIMFMAIATDNGGLKDTAIVTAWITEVKESIPPVFAQDEYCFILAENRDGSTTPIEVGTVMATDPDSDDIVTYALSDSSKFNINDTSGVISYIGTGEQYEVPSNGYTLKVFARDGEDSLATVDVIVLVVRDGDGDGYIDIETAEDLTTVVYNKNYEISNPDGIVINNNAHVIDIGSSSFVGSFEGNNRSITVALNAPISLFNEIGADGEVRNLMMRYNAPSTPSGSPKLELGMVAVRNVGMIKNVAVWGTISTNGVGGGIVAYNEGTIKNSYVIVDMESKANTTKMGGIAGVNSGTIMDVYAAHVTKKPSAVSGRYVGGLVGENKASSMITNGYVIGPVPEGAVRGYLVGVNNGMVTNSYWDGEWVGQSVGQGTRGLNQVSQISHDSLISGSSLLGNSFEYAVDQYPKIKPDTLNSLVVGQNHDYLSTIVIDSSTVGWRFWSMSVSGTSWQSFVDVNALRGYNGTASGSYNMYYNYDGSAWDPKTSGSNLPDVVQDGKGFIYYTFANSLDFRVLSIGYPNSEDVNVALHSDGWNTLGNPYDRDLAANPSAVAAWTLAGGALSSNMVQYWDGVMFKVPTTTDHLPMGHGFFIKNSTAGSITIPYSGATTNKSKEVEPNMIYLSAKGYNKDLSRRTEDNVFLLFTEEGSYGNDLYDAELLQPYSQYDTKGSYRMMMGIKDESDSDLYKVRSLPMTLDRVVQYDLVIESEGGIEDYELRWDHVSLPSDWLVYIENLSTGEKVEVKEGEVYQYKGFSKLGPNGVNKVTPFATSSLEASNTAAIRLVIDPAGGELILPPDELALHQNYPNPFNPVTVIPFDIPEQSVVNLTVYNILGQKVTSLINNKQYETGRYTLNWDASRYASGLYIYVLEVGTQRLMKKLTLIK